jgi:FixJ family two-component response regulator
VIEDVVMPQVSGIELLQTLKPGYPDRPIVLIADQVSIDLAVKTIRNKLKS